MGITTDTVRPHRGLMIHITTSAAIVDGIRITANGNGTARECSMDTVRIRDMDNIRTGAGS